MHVSAEEVHIGAGIFMPERAQLLALRNHLVTNHAPLRAELQARRLGAVGLAPITGHPLTRPPKGFSEAADAMDLLLCREWGVSGSFPVAMALSSSFAREIARRFDRAAPLVAMLNEPLIGRPKRLSFMPLPLG